MRARLGWPLCTPLISSSVSLKKKVTLRSYLVAEQVKVGHCEFSGLDPCCGLVQSLAQDFPNGPGMAIKKKKKLPELERDRVRQT